MVDPLTTINVTIPCQDNVGSGNTPVIYSDTLLLIRSQWGFMYADAYRQGGQIVNGLTKVGPSPGYFCGGAKTICGDCPATVHSIRATAGIRRWVVAIGISPSCTDCGTGDRVQGLVSWRWNGTRFVWQGLVSAFVDPTPTPDQFRLSDDFAYCMDSPGHEWYEFDLVNKTVTTVPSPPPDQRQSSIDDFTYRFEKQDVQHMKFVREGETTLGTFCPNDKISRKQVAAIVWNAMKWQVQNPGMAPPVPPTQQFEDVPITDPFRSSIDALKAAGIIAGKSPCEEVEL